VVSLRIHSGYSQAENAEIISNRCPLSDQLALNSMSVVTYTVDAIE
jgi:hypothetical protein